jgi:arginine-tRNA-protein transferase
MKPDLRQLALYLSAPHACSYLPDRLSSTLFVDPEASMDMASYSELLHYGFRRSGAMVYAPRCEHCRQCISVRIPVQDFEPRRIHRRVLRRNHALVMERKPAEYDPEAFALYQRYTRARHEDGEMANATPQSYLSFLTADWCSTEFLTFRLAERLVAVAVTDRAEDGLSAVYTFFEPELATRSLGTSAILHQIELARTLGLPYLYLGYWIRDSRKMAYKASFRPIELWRNGHWQRLAVGDDPPG